MNANDVLRAALDQNHMILTAYLGDLSDADLLNRPVPGANHAAWQIGHLIAAECMFTKMCGGSPPELPAGFEDQHGKAGASKDAGFLTKKQYLDLYKQVRESALACLAKQSEADLDKPITGDIARIAPTVGRLFVLMANHELMHAGQFTVLRRKLGKPVLF